MNRFTKAAISTIVAGVTVFGAATAAVAGGNDSRGGYGGNGRNFGHGGGYGGGFGHGGGYGNGFGGFGRGGGAHARAAAIGSPGILSGNVVQVPINIPINVCGNGIGIIALLNPTAGNVCINS
ncbi:chaplin [Streptomyces sp. NPDC002574]|uniref:chaplin n=1 Tax=Streptomyces sp. NPDC002574 TaxID=3364652 RepID=UPI00367AED2C